MKKSISSICEKIWTIENTYQLSKKKPYGSYYWQSIRMRIYYKIATYSNVLSTPHPFSSKKLWRIKFLMSSIIGFSKNLFKLNDLLKSEVIVFEHYRTKTLLEKNQNIDPYSYFYINKQLNKSKKIIVFSQTQNGYLEKNEGFSRFSIDFIETIRSSLGSIISNVPFKLDSESKKAAEELDLVINKKNFFEKEFRRGIIEYRIQYIIYSIIFSITRNTKEIIFIDAYSSRAGIIAKAKQRGMTIREIQHGVINKYHMGYSYPKDYNKNLMPDHLMTWSKFWKDEISKHWPQKIEIYGYDYLFHLSQHYMEKYTKKERTIIIISQGAISKKISKQIYLNHKKFKKFQVYYKLHPSEFSEWHLDANLLKLKSLPNFEIVKNKDLYELFAYCQYQIGVFSTALHEGLVFQCKTILIDLPGIEYMNNFPSYKLLHNWDPNES